MNISDNLVGKKLKIQLCGTMIVAGLFLSSNITGNVIEQDDNRIRVRDDVFLNDWVYYAWIKNYEEIE